VKYFNNSEAWEELVPMLEKQRKAILNPAWDPKKHSLRKRRVPRPNPKDKRFHSACSYVQTPRCIGKTRN